MPKKPTSRKSRGSGPTSRLQQLLHALTSAHRPTVGTRDPWHLILRENVVYLVDEATRDAAMQALRKRTGFDPTKLAQCPDRDLLAVCAAGRLASNQVRKLRECAALFRSVGDPRELVRLPQPEARRALKQFPGIGDPGADRLLLLAGRQPVLALDSNALRVLQRLGYGESAKSYATAYRSAQRAAMAELPADCDALLAASLALHAHGRTICRRTAPRCADCPLLASCPSATPT